MSVEIVETGLPGVVELRPRRFEDGRGFFAETFREDWLGDRLGGRRFVQDNHSLSGPRGVLRGLHYQLAPRAQAKLVRVVAGAVFDVAVDIRRSSPTFLRWTGVELSAGRFNQLFVPEGFAHGFVTLTPDAEVLYKVTDVYAPEFDRSIRFDDPAIGVAWPVPPDEISLSPKDAAAPPASASELFR